MIRNRGPFFRTSVGIQTLLDQLYHVCWIQPEHDSLAIQPRVLHPVTEQVRVLCLYLLLFQLSYVKEPAAICAFNQVADK